MTTDTVQINLSIHQYYRYKNKKYRYFGCQWKWSGEIWGFCKKYEFRQTPGEHVVWLTIGQLEEVQPYY